MSEDWFRQLQGEYAARLPAQLDAIRRLAHGDASLRDELLRALHRLGGTAGSHGFDSISSIAQGWERALHAGSKPDTDEPLRLLAAEVERAVAAFPAVGTRDAEDAPPSSPDDSEPRR